MGKVLQIRVWATTYSEDDVRKAWPKLFLLAWPKGEKIYVAKQGVRELVETLVDAHRLADWPEELRDATGEGLASVGNLFEELDIALADWNPALANELTDRIEDTLTTLEKELPKV